MKTKLLEKNSEQLCMHKRPVKSAFISPMLDTITYQAVQPHFSVLPKVGAESLLPTPCSFSSTAWVKPQSGHQRVSSLWMQAERALGTDNGWESFSLSLVNQGLTREMQSKLGETSLYKTFLASISLDAMIYHLYFKMRETQMLLKKTLDTLHCFIPLKWFNFCFKIEKASFKIQRNKMIKLKHCWKKIPEGNRR